MNQQNPNPQTDDEARIKGRKKKKGGAWHVQCRANKEALFGRSQDWGRWNAKGYATKEIRDENLERLRVKYPFYDWRAAEDGDEPVETQ